MHGGTRTCFSADAATAWLAWASVGLVFVIGYVVLPFVGFVIGLLVVSFGGGGGSLYVGVLTAFLNVPPAIAVATSLATGIPTTAVGAYGHWRQGNINLRLGAVMLVAGVVGAVAGSFCSTLLPEVLYAKLTGAILVFLAVQMAWSLVRRHARGDSSKSGPASGGTVKACAYGLLGGLMAGVVGLSGGGPIVAGLMVLGCTSLETVGTSVLVLLGIAVTGFSMHAGTGDVDWALAALLASGTVCGAYAAPRILARIDQAKLDVVLQPTMIVLCVAMGVILLAR